MKTNVLLWISVVFPLVCGAQDPRPTPIPTPRVIILEKEREQLEVRRASADKEYSKGNIAKESHDKSMREYKDGIDKYRSEAKTMAAGDKRERSSRERSSVGSHDK